MNCRSLRGFSSPWLCEVPAVQMFQELCAQPAVICCSGCSLSAKPFESGQYLDIYGITRDQAGEYECSAENDVSVPDVKKVKVTVNCKCCSVLPSVLLGEQSLQLELLLWPRAGGALLSVGHLGATWVPALVVG